MSKSGTKQRRKTKFDQASLAGDTSKQTPEQAARYLAFADPTQPKVKAMLASVLLKDKKAALQEEKDAEQKRLIGILKAAEARNRLRNARLQYQALRVSPGRWQVCGVPSGRAVRVSQALTVHERGGKVGTCRRCTQRDRPDPLATDGANGNVAQSRGRNNALGVTSLSGLQCM